MEITQITQIKSKPISEAILNDIKQSAEWKKFFKSIDLNVFTTSKGNNVFYIKTILGNFAKSPKPNNLTYKELLEIDKLCEELKIAFIKIDSGLNQNEDILIKNNYIKSKNPITASKIQLIDLTNKPELIFNNFSKSAKYSVKRSIREKDKVVFINNPTPEDIKDFYENTHNFRAKKRGFSIFNYQNTLNCINSFKNNVVLCNVYNKKDNLCGGKIFLIHNNMAYYIFGGTTEIGQKSKSGYLLVWKCIAYFKKRGLKTINFDGIYDNRYHDIFKSWIPFSNFKLKFGGHIVNYPASYIKFYNPIYKMLPLYFKRNL